MARRLLGEISPLTYRIVSERMILLRHLRNLRERKVLVTTRSPEFLPVTGTPR